MTYRFIGLLAALSCGTNASLSQGFAQDGIPSMSYDYSIAATLPSLSLQPPTLGIRPPARAQSPFDIVIQPGGNLAANTPALAAFNRAAGQWERYFQDPVTVIIAANLIPNSNPLLLGGASPVLFTTPFYGVRSSEAGLAQLVVHDNQGSPYQATTDALPTTAAGLSFKVDAGDLIATGPAPYGMNGMATKANFKALGYPVSFLDLITPGGTPAEKAIDAIIEFNSNQTFDYDRSDGIRPGAIDFESVAAHELGHALGFVSDLDSADLVHWGFGETYIIATPSTLDLFRFEEGTALDPETLTEFQSFPRSFQTGVGANTDIIIPGQFASSAELAMSTGSLDPAGDGRQLSHWKDDALTQNTIGLLDPTLSFGASKQITANDLVALDLIGWDVTYRAVPESGSLMPVSALAAGVGGLFWNVRRRKSAQRI